MAALLPGAMADIIGNASTLYLADYWTLTLHHLVWSGRLPYPVRARWERGDRIDDRPFHFVSELATDLADASRDALTLFEESAARAITDAASFVEQFTRPLDIRPYGLPVYLDGQWHLPARRETLVEPMPPSTSEPTMEEVDAIDASASVSDAASETMQVVESATPSVENVAKKNDDDAMAATPSPAADDRSRPVLDDQAFTVRHGGRSYRFAARNKQLFALLERVARRPGYRVLYNDLRSIGDVWDGTSVEDSTIRGSVARLRKLLATRGMAGLSGRILTGTYRGNGYVMLRVDDEDEEV